jgi:maltose O-acetyltransferase
MAHAWPRGYPVMPKGLRAFADRYRTMVKTARKAAGVRHRLRGEVDLADLVERGLTVGREVYVANWSLIDQIAPYLISIGDETVISPRVQILAHDAAGQKQLGYTRLAPVTIGRKVYIGADSTILAGATIGDEAIIGAGSLVNGEIPAGAVAVGRPARVVSTTAEFLAKRRLKLAEAPRFTHDDIATPEGRAAVRARIAEHGEGFIP